MTKNSVLLVAEKPSAAIAFATVKGPYRQREGYLEGGDYLAGWCLGHLVEDAPARAYNPAFSKWRYEDLPIVPETWKYQVIEDTKKQYEILTGLMLDDRVTEIWNCCDCGREGELIFRLVYNQCGCTKPVKRLWISSLEEAAIRRGFENLRDSADFDSLYQAALCRQRADWLVGINATRLFSTLYRGTTLNVGRVMTPTLALLSDREKAIAGFQKEKFYTVELNFPGFHAVSERITAKEDAEKLCAACEGAEAVVKTVARQEKTERPPKLYDLTSLQREANRLFGLTAQQTLNALQSLYEKKLATYPRTDSRYITDDMAERIPALCGKVAKALALVPAVPSAENVRVIVDNSKVTDHHAVLPTEQIARIDMSTLTEGEKTILRMIALRLLCAVGEPHQYAETTAELFCGGAVFTAKGRTVTAGGWKAAEKAFPETQRARKKEQDPDPPLPALTEGETLQSRNAAVKQGTTKPPQRFTEDTLLSAMQRASAEEFAEIEAPEHTGLGTPATRSRIIEKLIKNGFAEREKRQLVPTAKGMELIQVLPDSLKSAATTAQWEEKLRKVERGELDGAVFLSGIVSLLRELVGSYRSVTVNASALTQNRSTVVGICPRCGRNVIEERNRFCCEGCYDGKACGFVLRKDNRFFTGKGKQLTKRIVEKLLKDGRVHMTKLHSEKKGTDYDADVVMEDTGGKYVNFRLEFNRK